MSKETKLKLNEAIGQWKSITPEFLLKRENTDLLQELRILAKDTRQTAARVPLLKLGDKEVIGSGLEALRAENSRNSAVNQFGLSGNHKIIPLLVDDLNKEESPQLIRTEDLARLPVSLAAASAIKGIIQESPVFSAAVKDWAKGLPRVSPGLRDGVRGWWNINKHAIEKEDYSSVIPGPAVEQVPPGRVIPETSEPETPDAASSEAPQVSPVIPTTPPSPSLPVSIIAESSAGVDQKKPLWLWILGVPTLIAIAWVALRRRT